MKTDLYTKLVLTIIALCLMLDLVRDVSPPARAEGVMRVDITAIGGSSLGSGGLPVRVDLASVGGRSVSDGVPVRAEP
ncbi:MAG: hypothetical protein HY319_26530 [Armatimonadetes bacterium]|nr:hypothetical protein [Armatimonadota bacterium]